jgi:hypothetical protein
MFPFRQGTTQVYSPFGSYMVEQHDIGCPQRYLDDLPRPDVTFGKGHPLAESRAAAQPVPSKT